VDCSIDLGELLSRVLSLYPSRAPIHFCLCLLKALTTGHKDFLSWAWGVVARVGPPLGKLNLTAPCFPCQLRYSGLLEYDLQDELDKSAKFQPGLDESTMDPRL